MRRGGGGFPYPPPFRGKVKIINFKHEIKYIENIWRKCNFITKLLYKLLTDLLDDKLIFKGSFTYLK